jgi:hypothetical protein
MPTIKIGLIKFKTNTTEYYPDGETHHYVVRILEEFDTSYKIKYGEKVSFTDYRIPVSTFPKIVKKERVYDIKEKEVSTFKLILIRLGFNIL